MPKMQFKSNAKPSLYAYPSPLKEEKEKEKGKVIDQVSKYSSLDMCNVTGFYSNSISHS